MTGVLDVVVAFLLVVGTFWNLLAALGLQQFEDVFARMHAATKAATLGVAMVLLGAALSLDSPGDTAKLLLVVVLQFVTMPVSSHMIGRATYRTGTELAAGTTIDELAESGLGTPHRDR